MSRLLIGTPSPRLGRFSARRRHDPVGGRFHEAHNQGRDVILVVSGWDGLTTNQASLLDIIWDLRRPDNVPTVTLRVYTQGIFFNLNVDQVCAVLRHETDPMNILISFSKI